MIDGCVIETGKTCENCGKSLLRGIVPSDKNYELMRIAFPNGYNFRCECEHKKTLFERQEEYRNMKKKLHEKRIAESGIPEDGQKKTMNNFVSRSGAEKAFRICLRYIEKFDKVGVSDGKGLIIYGGTGSGKTHLVSAIGMYVISAGKTVRYVNCVKLFSDLQICIQEGESQSSIIDEMIECDLLILDDLGSEKTSEWTMIVYQTLIDSRISKIKPTIITTNSKPEDLNSSLSEKTVDRILSTSDERFYQVSNSASSYRTNGE